MPDSDLHGPFETEDDALDDAREGMDYDDDADIDTSSEED